MVFPGATSSPISGGDTNQGAIVNRKRGTKWAALLSAGTIILVLALSHAVQATYLPASSFNNGGAQVSHQDHLLSLTIGAPIIGSLSNASAQVGIGFWYIADGTASPGLSDTPPASYTTILYQNSPNPFNPSTTIRFALGRAGAVTLRLYDVQGRELATLINENMDVGEHSLVFQPRGLASGVYLYQLKTPDATTTRRLMLLK